MAEYIERDKVLALETFTQDADGFDCAVVLSADIRRCCAADVVEVRHGKWMPTPEYDSCWCSRCKKQYTGFFASDWNYCPNCGCRMDGGADNDPS